MNITESPQSTSQQKKQFLRDKAVQPVKTLKWLLGKTGPGFITGAADDDPSGLATYAQTGAIFEYSQLWLVWLTCPSMIVI